MSARMRLSFIGAAADVASLAVANVLAVWLRSQAQRLLEIDRLGFKLDWSLGVIAAAVFATFYLHGLYEREVYVSRPLHLWTLARAAVVAFAMSALAVYLLKSDRVDQSRFILLLTFVIFLPISSALRVGLVDGLFRRWIGKPGRLTLVVGDSPAAGVLVDRLSELRGFAPVQALAPSRLRPEVGSSMSALIDACSSQTDSVGAVFIDVLSVTPREVFDITHAARPRGVDVYVLSRLLGPLEGNQLLSALFRAPIIRVRRSLEKASAHLTKRAFDVVGASTLLLLALPLVAALALVIRATSSGPIFYTQTRVGRFGVPFRFYKFRSMVVNDDASEHAEYAKAFIHGEAEKVAAGQRGEVYKQVDDARITPVGRFIRKYSLDEIPQFWNVLVGDMSLVGPRPPLPYEVEHYDAWATLRLLIQPGVTGIWQVEGRSRVSFDEMVLQDLMYAKNMRLCVDVRLCLRTVPAAILGYGGG